MVVKSYLFDTCFLIDLEREMRRGPGKAHQFLQVHISARPCLSWTVAGEFTEGFGDIHHPACAAMLARFEILPMDQSTAHHYDMTTRYLWGRWTDYAKTGHGGNQLLKDLDPSHFQWSIIRTLSGSMSAKEIIRVEKTEMKKHGSKAVRLNLQ